MEPIKNLISHSVQRAGIGKQIQASHVVETSETVLREVFGKDSEKEVRPLYFKNRTLTVSCISSAFAQEIKLHEGTIVGHINDVLGSPVVERIRYLL